MLEAELARTQAELAIVQNLVRSSLTDEPSVPEDLHIAGPGTSIGKGKGKEKIRDDDSHYFDSYAENGECPSAPEDVQALLAVAV